jgi:hypothetical protein
MVKIDKSKPYLRKHIWKTSGDFWFVDPMDLDRALQATENPLHAIQETLGSDFEALDRLFEGKGVEKALIVRIEKALDDQPFRPHPIHFAETGLSPS